MNIIERIREAMQDDDDNLDKQSELLLRAYDETDDAGRELIDTVCVCLCGYKLTTLRAEEGRLSIG